MPFFLRGKIYHYRWKVNGKTRTRSTGQTDRQEAERVVAGWRREWASGEVIYLSQAIEREIPLIRRRISEGQARKASSVLGQFLKYSGDLRLVEIDTGTLQTYLDHRMDLRRAQSTLVKDVCLIRRMLKRNHVPIERVEYSGRKIEVRAFEEEELRRFLAACKPDERAVALLLYATGARLAEVIPSEKSSHTPLLKEEVNFETGEVVLRSSKRRKGATMDFRTHLVSRDLGLLLKEQAEAHSGLCLFPGWPASWRVFQAICKRAGIERYDSLGRKLSWHSFRHTYASRMAGRMSSLQLQKRLGHSKVETTAIYVDQVETTPPVEIGQYLPGQGVATPCLEKGGE